MPRLAAQVELDGAKQKALSRGLRLNRIDSRRVAVKRAAVAARGNESMVVQGQPRR